MTSRSMSVVGAIGAALTFATANLPAGTPAWVTLMLGALCAGVMAYLGTTHPGRR